ncbi:MAG: PEP-CTERM sorting domain-containing protein [Verrucomicrobiaceae bacterium]
MKGTQNKLGTYLTLAAGAGVAVPSANAATTVTFYGKNSANDTNANPVGIGLFSGPSNDGFGAFFSTASYFTRFNSDAALGGNDGKAGYAIGFGAVAGEMNFVGISFNGNDGQYEAVGQFFVDATNFNNSYLIAIATSNPVPNPQNLSAVGGSTLGVANGQSAIEAVPEPSGLALLALGSVGLAARRQRRKSA